MRAAATPLEGEALRIPAALLASAAIAATLLTAPAARAQYGPHEGSRDGVHDGLFLRLQAGIGYLHADADFSGGTSSAYGGAGVLGLAVGGAVAENVVLFGEIWGMSAVNPRLRFEGSTTTLQDSSLNYGGVGLGIGTFVMPAHVYLAVSVDLTRLGISNNDGSNSYSNSDVGLAVTATLGKQFWLSRYAGLGLSVTAIGGGNRDNNTDSNSATYRTFTAYGALSLTFG
jgi:hypothetical protein